MQDGPHRPGRGGGRRRAAPRAARPATLLETLGRIHLARRDWTAGRPGGRRCCAGRATRGARRWRTALEAASLRGQGRTAETVALLRGAAPATATPRPWRSWCGPRWRRATSPARRRYLDGVLAKDPGEPAAAGCCRPGSRRCAGDAAAAEARLPRADRRRARPGAGAPGAMSPARRPGPRRRRRWRRSTPGSPPRPATARLLLRQGGAARGGGRHRRRDRALRGALCPRHRLGGAGQQPREPADQPSRRPGEPRAGLRHRPAAARLGRAAVPGHLRLDPAPARRQRPGARLPRAGRRGAARQRRWCSSTAARRSSRSAAPRRARASFERALAAAAAGSPLPQAETVGARLARPPRRPRRG